MAYCPACGVEVSTKTCPLCQYTIKQDIHTKPFSHEVIKRKFDDNLTIGQRKAIINSSVWFFSFMSMAVCITVNYMVSKNISWSIIPVVPIFYLGFFTSVCLYSKKLLRIVLLFLGILSMLIILGLVIPGTKTMSISIPLTVFLFIIIGIIFIIYKKSSNHGSNIGGWITLGVAIYLVAIELVIRYALESPIKLTWSLLTTVTLSPISFFLFYLHYNISKKVNLGKVFHT